MPSVLVVMTVYNGVALGTHRRYFLSYMSVEFPCVLSSSRARGAGGIEGQRPRHIRAAAMAR